MAPKKLRSVHVITKLRKLKPKKRFYKQPIFWFLLAGIVLISLLVYFSFFYDGLQLKYISISGNGKTDAWKIQNIATSTASKKLISFGSINLSTENIFWVDTHAISREILNQFPGISDAKIKKNLPQSIDIQIVERKPIAIFCNQGTNQNYEDCFLIDESGVIFESVEPGTENMAVIRDENPHFTFAGNKIIGKAIMDDISKITTYMSDTLYIPAKEIFLSNPMRLNVKTSENWQIYFDLNSNIDLQIEKLNLLLTDEITPDLRASLQYIDLRFADRAFYQ